MQDKNAEKGAGLFMAGGCSAWKSKSGDFLLSKSARIQNKNCSLT
jgi:hypothetical protein